MNATTEPQPARITRDITVRVYGLGMVTIPANYETTARWSTGSEDLLVVKYEGKSALVKPSAVRFL